MNEDRFRNQLVQELHNLNHNIRELNTNLNNKEKDEELNDFLNTANSICADIYNWACKYDKAKDDQEIINGYRKEIRKTINNLYSLFGL